MARTNSVAKNETNIDDLATQVAILKDDIATLTQSLGEFGKTKGKHLRAVAEDAAADLKARGEEHAATVKAHANNLQDEANRFVVEKPAAALGIAAGLGFLVGFMASRK